MRKRPLDDATYDCLSRELLTAAYQEAKGRTPAPGIAGNLPRLARETRRRMLARSRPLDTAGSGDLLYVPEMRLNLDDKNAGPGSWTAVLFSNRKDESAMTGEKILLLLVGPVEDCPEWIAGGSSPRMPAAAATPEGITTVIEVFSARPNRPQGAIGPTQADTRM